jgi:hypothetical protein
VIERGFGRLKQWKFIDGVINSEYIPIIGKIIKILCAIDNAYFSPLFEDNDELCFESNEIKNNLELANDIMINEAKSIGWKKINVINIHNCDVDIPLYDEIDIKRWSSEYGIRMGMSYLNHMKDKWTFHLNSRFPRTMLIKNIASRYKSFKAKKHSVWIRFGLTNFDNIMSYCTCKSGLRTAGGPCGHAVSVLIGLKYFMKQETIPDFYCKSKQLFDIVLDCDSIKNAVQCFPSNNDTKFNIDDEIFSTNDEIFSTNDENITENDDDDKEIVMPFEETPRLLPNEYPDDLKKTNKIHRLSINDYDDDLKKTNKIPRLLINDYNDDLTKTNKIPRLLINDCDDDLKKTNNIPRLLINDYDNDLKETNKIPRLLINYCDDDLKKINNIPRLLINDYHDDLKKTNKIQDLLINEKPWRQKKKPKLFNNDSNM